MMFRKVFFKLRNVHWNISRLYSSLIIDFPLLLIVAYLLVFSLFCFGLFNLKVNQDNESLMQIKNSQHAKDKQKMIEHFPVNYSMYLPQLLPDLGNYVEFIVKIKPEYVKNYSFLNETFLSEYNHIYDQVFSLRIKSGLNYTGICPLRLEKCAVEGSIIRSELFQRDFLESKACFKCNEPGKLYINDKLMDGTSFDFAFGKNMRYEKRIDEAENDCFVTWVTLIRNRFSLRDANDQDKQNAISFQNEFVSLMQKIEPNLNLVDITYFASHLKEKVTIEYSLTDVKFVAIAFILFWAIFLVQMLFDLRNLFFCWSKKNYEEGENEERSYLRSRFFGVKSICRDGSCLLVLAAFAQFLLTTFATAGLISIFSIELNQLLIYYPLILMINTCHQSLLIFKVANVEKLRKKLEMVKSSENDDENADFMKMEIIKEHMAKACQKTLVPSFQATLTTIVAYLSIGFTCAFEAIEIYSLFITLSSLTNFFGIVCFFCPCVALQLKRAAKFETKKKIFFFKPSKSSAILFAESNKNDVIYYEKGQALIQSGINTNTSVSPITNHEETRFECDTPDSDERSSSMDRDELYLNLNQGAEEAMRDPLLHNTDPSSPSSSSNCDSLKKETSNEPGGNKISEKICHTEHTKKNQPFNYQIILKLIKYLMLIIFVAYLSFNVFICIICVGNHLKIDLPIEKLVPAKSYVAKHLELHRGEFELGPMYTVAFFGPVNYTGGLLDSIVQHVKAFPNISDMTINWYDEAIKSEEFYPEKGQALVRGIEGLNDNPKYVYTAFLVEKASELWPNTSNINELVAKSRIFFQMKHFDATIKESFVIEQIKEMLEEEFKLNKDQFVLFSPTDVFYETMREILPSTLALFTLSAESIFFVSLFIIFELKVIFIQMLIVISLVTSIVANLLLFGLTLNFFVLIQLVLLPSFIFEFVFHLGYLFLYKSTRKQRKFNKTPMFQTFAHSQSSASSTSSSLSSSSIETESSNQQRKINHAIKNSTLHSSSYLLSISLFAFSILAFCDTYNFQLLFLTLMSTCLNTALHLFIFYPNFLHLFATYN